MFELSTIAETSKHGYKQNGKTIFPILNPRLKKVKTILLIMGMDIHVTNVKPRRRVLSIKLKNIYGNKQRIGNVRIFTASGTTSL